MSLIDEGLSEFNYFLNSYIEFIESNPGIHPFEKAFQISQFASMPHDHADPHLKIKISSRMYEFFKDFNDNNKIVPSLDECTSDSTLISVFVHEWCFRHGEDLFFNEQYLEALPFLNDVLSGSPVDSFGVRDYIPIALIESGQLEEADLFLKKRLKIDSAFLYNRALLDYLIGRKGDFEEHAKAAHDSNSWITNYLTGRKKIPIRVTVYADDDSVGTANEAKSYLFGIGKIWFKHKEIIKELDRITQDRKPRKITKSSNPFKPYCYSKEELEMMHTDIINCHSMRHEELLGKVCKWSTRIFESSPWLHCFERAVFLHFSDEHEPIACHFTGNLGEVIGANVYISESEYEECMTIINDLDDHEQDPMLIDLKMNVYSSYMRSFFITREPEMRISQKNRNIIKKVCPPDQDGTLISPEIKHRGLDYQMCNKEELAFCLLGLLTLYHSILSFSKSKVNYSIRIDYNDDSLINTAITHHALELRNQIKKREHDVTSLLNKFNKETRFATTNTFDLNVAWLGNLGFIKEKESETSKTVGAVLLISPKGEVFDLNIYEGEENPLRAFIQSLKKLVKRSNSKPRNIIYLDSPIAVKAQRELTALDIPQQISQGNEDILDAVHEVLDRFVKDSRDDMKMN